MPLRKSQHVLGTRSDGHSAVTPTRDFTDSSLALRHLHPVTTPDATQWPCTVSQARERQLCLHRADLRPGQKHETTYYNKLSTCWLWPGAGHPALLGGQQEAGPGRWGGGSKPGQPATSQPEKTRTGTSEMTLGIGDTAHRRQIPTTSEEAERQEGGWPLPRPPTSHEP